MARPPQDPRKPQTPPDAVQVFALGEAFNADGVSKAVPLDSKPDAAPLFQLLNQQNQAATAPNGDVAFGLSDAMSAIGASFSSGPSYSRPDSILGRVVGSTFDDAASQQTIGSTLAGKFTVPTVENLRFADPVAGNQRISSTFGMRVHPITGGHKPHHGVDWAAPAGTDILAAAPGVVVYSGKVNGYGNTVVMLHHDNDHGYFYTLYGHNKQNLAHVGQVVQAGEHIAELGSTGASTGNHLHFEVGRLNGNGRVTVVDPVAAVHGGLTAERVANMDGQNAGRYVSGLFRNMDIQTSNVQIAQAPAGPAPTLN